MVLANEKNLFYRLKSGQEFERKEMFDMLVESSKGFLEKGGKGMVLNGTIENSSHFGFWMKGYWQGTYDKYIKVSRKDKNLNPYYVKLSYFRDLEEGPFTARHSHQI